MELLKQLKEHYEEEKQRLLELKQRIVEREELLQDAFNRKQSIFLLSEYEYFQYFDEIPVISCDWWLNDEGHIDNTQIAVSFDEGYVYEEGFNVHNNAGVRPCLILNDTVKSCSSFHKQEDGSVLYCGIRWLSIEQDIYIAEMPIAFMPLNEVHEFLFEWERVRKDIW